ncbi:hypothetical protein HBA54_23450 [Pelagibius litoralis]|uniref:Uncharacterized protein n=1 Tax=Pelagibius litoralis TaxID=374515 RepID=A0A967KHS0_9PROT|nr:hypothetical protein [Pelagibius litoralis]NIA71551.1 hypothetical protein [Pelagibius litoralis]
MLKITSLVLAAAVTATAAIPSVALAIDNGPCDHCTMEPIVVKGDRPEKEKAEMPTQNLTVGQPALVILTPMPKIGAPTVRADESRN